MRYERFLTQDMSRLQRREFWDKYSDLNHNHTTASSDPAARSSGASPRTTLLGLLKARGAAPEPLGFQRFDKEVLPLK